MTLASLSLIAGLVGLGVGTWPMSPWGWILLAPTTGAVAILYILYFPADAARANKWLRTRKRGTRIALALVGVALVAVAGGAISAVA